jgi:hypothetical protein
LERRTEQEGVLLVTNATELLRASTTAALRPLLLRTALQSTAPLAPSRKGLARRRGQRQASAERTEDDRTARQAEEGCLPLCLELDMVPWTRMDALRRWTR